MKKILDKKFIDFIKNQINYDNVVNFIVFGTGDPNTKGKYDYCFDQYEVRKRISKWYAELKFGSDFDDQFTKNLLTVLTKINLNNYVSEIDYFLKVNYTKQQNELGILFHYSWYLGLWLLNDRGANGVRYNLISDVFKKYVNDYDDYKEEVELFQDQIFKQDDKLRKEKEKLKKDTLKKKFPYTKTSLKQLIINSSLDKNLKESIIESIKDSDDITDLVENGVICHLDYCLEFLQEMDIKTWNLSENEDQKLDNYLLKYFSETIPNFPLPIMTEDYVLLYEPGKTYNFSEDELPKILPEVTEKYYILWVSAKNSERTYHFSTVPLKFEECDSIRTIFLNKDWEAIKSLRKKFDDNKDNFNSKIKDMIEDPSFVPSANLKIASKTDIRYYFDEKIKRNNN